MIAVTGSGGSIGCALTALMARRGEDAVHFPNRAELDLAGPVEPLTAWLAIRRPSAIIHLAGWRQGGDVASAFRDNVTATYNLLSAVGLMPEPARVVVASSAAVYGDACGRAPLRVGDIRRPLNLYGASKALQEDTCALARASAGTDISIARIFNIFGAPGDTWSVIPSMIARIIASADGDIVPVRNARCTRDFVHIEEVCDALLLAATQVSPPAVFNVATGVGTSIGDLACRIAKALERSIEFRFDDVLDATTLVESVGDPADATAMGWTHSVFSDDHIADLTRALKTH